MNQGNDHQFNKINFAEALKYWRNFHGMSQLELVEALSLSHNSFQGINQPMLSKWEHGNGQPSLMRRIGVAIYFSQPYQFQPDEQRIIQSVDKYDDVFVGHDPIYSYPIDAFKHYKWEELPEDYRQQITLAHDTYRDVTLSTLISRLGVEDIRVVMVMHNQSIFGHAIFGTNEFGQECLLNYLAIDKPCYHEVHNYICQLYKGKTLLVATYSPLATTMLSDIYIPVKYHHGGVTVFECNVDTLNSNPFFKQLFSDGRIVSLLSRHQTIQREKRVANEFNAEKTVLV
ncbi:helix-turn-helix domain-containing protein [Vibrio methylphosphonaticus]|uniref:helix-turn-helix domain-containing protein n=1 Tax=Vibrio methylphosphonaticus TaxID=2946866 RepID=UPI00202AAE84|nr:helix-turn-helix transcriptional regulator [Vibrio methylphosphonaticus]MCL9777489.1 helix-turn-helix transcriptional regulator [Vibrio methylphosphonaticus]